MAALTVNTTASNGPVGLGEKAFSDPATVLPFKVLSREIDFAKQNFAKNANYVVMPIPKGFLAKYIAVEQTGAIDADVTFTFATKKDATKAIGGNFAFVDDATGWLRSVQPVKTDAAYAASTSAGSPTSAIAIPGEILFAQDDVLCLKVPDTEDLTTGGMKVMLIGFMPFGDSPEFGNGSEPMRTAASSGLDNCASAEYDD